MDEVYQTARVKQSSWRLDDDQDSNADRTKRFRANENLFSKRTDNARLTSCERGGRKESHGHGLIQAHSRRRCCKKLFIVSKGKHRSKLAILVTCTAWPLHSSARHMHDSVVIDDFAGRTEMKQLCRSAIYVTLLISSTAAIAGPHLTTQQCNDYPF